MKRDLIIVSELFYPDKTSTAYIMTKIADKLTTSANLTVISGNHYYNGDMFENGISVKPYKIVRINSGKLDKNKLLSRIYKLVSTSWKLYRKLSSIVKDNSEVIIVTNPAPFLLLASRLKRNKKFNLNIIVQDVFPENAKAAGLISSKNILYKCLLKIWEHSYSRADRLIVCGRDMKDVFQQKLGRFKDVPSIEVIENWADINNDFFDNSKNENKTVEILFAGNIGRCQGVENFLEIFKEAKNQDINVTFRGDGANVPFIKNFICNNPEIKINYGGKYSREEQFNILRNCDIALVTLTDNMYGLGVPSKSYNVMAAGKPILYIGDPNSEIAMVIRDYGIGYYFDPQDKEGLKNWLNSIDSTYRDEFRKKGLKAKKLAETIYSEDAILEKYSNLFPIL